MKGEILWHIVAAFVLDRGRTGGHGRTRRPGRLLISVLLLMLLMTGWLLLMLMRGMI